MHRLNGANCQVYSKNGVYNGRYTCIVQIEDNEKNGILGNMPVSGRKEYIIIKNIKESLKDCKITIYNCHKNEYIVLKNYEVQNERIENDGIYIFDDEQNITSRIENITKDEYDKLQTQGVSIIDWRNITTEINGQKVSKDKSFEYLCSDLINKMKIVKEGNFHPQGGTDGGRDYIWMWPIVDNMEIDFLDLPSEKWVMQCKYSESTNTKLKKTEVWDEIVKVIQHNPSHYIIFTNRNITTSLFDWWKEVSKFDNRRKKFIPFSLHLVNKDDIERMLDIWPSIREKYFKSS